MTYLDSFILPPENRQVYPYKQMYEKGLEMIEFAPITIFYGSNGSGKSTLLNIIASKIGINNKTLGNTSEYFDGFVRKCTDASMNIPEDSMFIRSEDIMELIAGRRKKNASIDKTGLQKDLINLLRGLWKSKCIFRMNLRISMKMEQLQ